MKKLTPEQRLANAKKSALKANSEVQKLELQIKSKKEKNTQKPIWETVTTLPQVYKHLKVDPKKDVIKIDGFDNEEHNVLENLVKKMRICKVYNEGKVLTRKDNRWYPWWYLDSSGSGLVFAHSACNVDGATTSSAARLSFLQKLSTESYAKNFKDVEEGIIGL